MASTTAGNESRIVLHMWSATANRWRTAPARPVAPVRVVLVRGAEGWRMESAQRLG